VFPSALVTAMGTRGEDALLDAVDELTRSGVLVEEVRDDGLRYRFHHEDFPDVVTRSLEPAERAELHRAIAVAVERRFPLERRSLAHVLSRHFRHGDRPDRAFRYQLDVAVQAARRGDLAAALRRLDDARAAARRPGPAWGWRRAKIELVRADLLIDFGRAKDALEVADVRLAEDARRPDIVRSLLLMRRAAAQAALGRIDEALVSIGRMRRSGLSAAIEARVLELEGRIRVARGELTRARQVLEAAVGRARAAGNDDFADDLGGTIGMVLHHQGEHEEALRRLEDALQRARLRDRTKRVAELVGYIGLVHAARNSTTGAIACFREALELAEARGVRADRERWAGAMGIVLSRLHQFEDAEEKLREALELSVASGNREGESTWRTELGVHHFEALRYDVAHDELARGLAIARDIGFARGEAWAEIHLGAVLLERSYDRVDEARERIEEGLERARETGNDDVRVVGLLFLSRAHRADGEIARARDALERADVLARASQNLHLRDRVDAERELLAGA
jgi:tetratricopeptide (TPR) repeat protein